MSLENVLSSITNLITGTPSPMQRLADFPYHAWTSQDEYYTILEAWYAGTPLNETIQAKNSSTVVEKYPLHLNPLKRTCEKHAAVLFGTSIDSLRFGTIPIRFRYKGDEKDEKKAKIIEEALMKVFSDSSAGALFVENGITSQYLGGCVFWAIWDPATQKIEISAPSPHEVILYPRNGNYWDIKEAWLCRVISSIEAAGYGINTSGDGPGATYYYIEHWTDDKYSIFINENPIVINGVTQKDIANPFGRVLCVYIPHIRDKHSFYGTPIINEAVKGIIREMNMRWADIGDAVSDDSHSITAVRNIHGTMKTVKIAGDSRSYIDLGSQIGLGANEGQPDMFSVNAKSASEPMLKFVEGLEEEYRKEVNHPAVADGVDQGSQRSSLTLTTRMWPLVSHAETERIFWTVGLQIFAKYLLKAMAIKDLNKVTKDMVGDDLDLLIEWCPMLPRDREVLVNEVAVRAASKTGSRKHLINLLGDVADSEDEIEEIRSEKDLDEKQTQPTNETQPADKKKSQSGGKTSSGAVKTSTD